MLTTPKQPPTEQREPDDSVNFAATYVFRDLPIASDLPRSPGYLRREIGDFRIEEKLLFEPTDDGEHLLILVRRSNLTTREVQSRLAHAFRESPKNVGYLGLKDKRSVATQWFSLPLPTPSRPISVPGVDILQQRRHKKKLRPSDGCQNWFEIRIRDVDPDSIDFNRMQFVPNYFGPQRFGRDGRNVISAMRWVQKGKPRISPFLKSIYLSSLRSYVFNLVLAKRVKRGDWCDVIDGDVQLDGAPTGPLWGRGRVLTTGLAREIEREAINRVAPIADALEWVGLQQARRSFAVAPTDLDYEINHATAVIRFALPSGSFATSVLHECFDLSDELN